MEKELKIKITDPETGEFVVKTKKQSEIPDLVSKATERGLVLEQMPPEKEVLESVKQKEREEKVSGLSALGTGLLAGISVESQDEIRGQIFGDEAQKKAELARKKAELEKPGAFGTGKFIGSLIPSTIAALGGQALGRPVGAAIGALTSSPAGAIPGSVVGAGLGGALGTGAIGALETLMEKPMGEKELDSDVAVAGILNAALAGFGRYVGPRVINRIAKKLTGKSTQLSVDEKFLAEQVGKLQRARSQYTLNKAKLKAGKLTSSEAMKIAKENTLLQKTIKEMNKKIQNSFLTQISTSAPSAAAQTFTGEEMTTEEQQQFEQLLLDEALRELQERKRLEREMSVRRPPM